MDTLWTVIFYILMATSIFPCIPALNKSIKAKIFVLVLQLCLCSILLVLGFCSNQWFITNLVCFLTILVLAKLLNKYLDKFEDEVIRKTYEATKTKNSSHQIIDAEYFTVCK